MSSDRHGEHYENFDKNGQNPGPFTKLFQSWDICTWYTMHGTPHQNGIVESGIVLCENGYEYVKL